MVRVQAARAPLGDPGGAGESQQRNTGAAQRRGATATANRTRSWESAISSNPSRCACVASHIHHQRRMLIKLIG